jgi:hypothetical protein
MVSAYELAEAEVERLSARPWTWGTPTSAKAIVTQTSDPAFEDLEWAWFPDLRVIYDGRNSLRTVKLPTDVAYHGVGVPQTLRRTDR